MSVAILVPESAEQAGVRPVASDVTSGQVLPIGMSFAKNLYERIGSPVSLQKEASEPGVEVPTSGKDVSVVKESDPLASILIGSKKGAPAGKEILGRGQSEENSVASSLVRSPATGGAVVHPKKLLVDASARAESSAKVELPADAVVAAPSFVAQAPTVGETGTNFALPEGKTPDTVVAAIPGAAERGVWNFNVTPPKMKEVVSSAKISKPQEDGNASKSIHKAVGSTAHENEIKTTLAVKPEVSGTPISSQTVATHAVPRGEIVGKTSEPSIEIVAGMKVSTQDSANSVDAAVQKGDAQGPKVGGMDTQLPSTSVGPKAIEQATGDPEKRVAALPALQESEGKMQSAPELSAGIVQAMFGRPDASANVATDAGRGFLGDSSVVKAVQGGGDHLPGLTLEPREGDAVVPDATPMNGVPRMFTATPTTLEVGVPNGTHGWLRVRAEMASGGGVNASVSAISSGGQEMLHRELPSLTAYLQQEKVSVNAVVIHAAAAESSKVGGSGSDANASMDGGGSQTPHRNSEGGEKLVRGGGMFPGRTGESISFTDADKDGSITPVLYDGGGTWLSVRA
jgi:hypothetical protein